ncbi:hypothetical protein RJ641_027691 [Dillenia turbinata]|uniref:Uncharacterized protein n=1 Tax=Dillenia turbinata TaxID=194707 RepID=A0AAN8ZIC7_9MAGN
MEKTREQQQQTEASNPSLKLAVAMALLKSKLFKNPNSQTSSESDAQHGSHYDMYPQTTACKCFFFDDLGKVSPNNDSQERNRRFNDVLRRRFLRHVRLKERRRKSNGSNDQFAFLILQAQEANFANWSHEAVDFILASLKNLQANDKNLELIEVIVNSLISRLIRRMESPSQGEGFYESDSQFYIQHLVRKLGNVHYIGQRVILLTSQRISAVAEALLFLDPFDRAFPCMHRNMFLMIQLIEFLVSDHFVTWSRDEGFENLLFEEWVTSLIHARKSLELLENRNGLYVIYMDRVVGELAKRVGQVSSSLQKVSPDILNKLFH